MPNSTCYLCNNLVETKDMVPIDGKPVCCSGHYTPDELASRFHIPVPLICKDLGITYKPLPYDLASLSTEYDEWHDLHCPGYKRQSADELECQLHNDQDGPDYRTKWLQEFIERWELACLHEVVNHDD